MNKLKAAIPFGQTLAACLVTCFPLFSAPALAAKLGESEYEQKIYSIPSNQIIFTCPATVYEIEIIEGLPNGYQSVTVDRDFANDRLNVIVNKKKSASDKFSFNIMCKDKRRNYATDMVPLGRVELP